MTKARRNYVVAIDKSGSMAEKGTFGMSRWDEAKEITVGIAKHCEMLDEDGIDVVVFANTIKTHSGVTADKVIQVFTESQPNGGTNTSGALEEIFVNYLKAPVIPVTVIVITDGVPNDQQAVAKSISSFTQNLKDDSDFGIQFIQVGSDASARKFLKSLDDDLVAAGAKFDIVDTLTSEEIEALSIDEVLERAISG
jgi:Mg-chelatase subunit ChlD